LIKKETRILGLSAVPGRLKRVPMIGIVFRGNLWVDGVLTCQIEPDRPEYLSVLERAIVQSRQYSQIRAVILSREKLTSAIQISVSDLSRRIDLPVIAILAKRPRSAASGQNKPRSTKLKAEQISIEISGRSMSLNAAGVSGPETQKIFDVACLKGERIPEAVRVASLIAKNLAASNIL
jgi:endonuclease V-like protein UPF0215 family